MLIKKIIIDNFESKIYYDTFVVLNWFPTVYLTKYYSYDDLNNITFI